MSRCKERKTEERRGREREGEGERERERAGDLQTQIFGSGDATAAAFPPRKYWPIYFLWGWKSHRTRWSSEGEGSLSLSLSRSRSLSRSFIHSLTFLDVTHYVLPHAFFLSSFLPSQQRNSLFIGRTHSTAAYLSEAFTYVCVREPDVHMASVLSNCLAGTKWEYWKVNIVLRKGGERKRNERQKETGRGRGRRWGRERREREREGERER